MSKRKRRWRNMIGVYIRDDAEANLIYIEHVYSFPMYDDRAAYLQFIGTQEPCTLWGGTWQLVAQL
jgi:hypothetical protein